MDMDSEIISANFSESTFIDQINNGSPTNHSTMPPICSLCRMTPSIDSYTYMNSATVGICGHCKFLLLEDLEMPTDELRRRRLHRGRRSITGSSESIEDFFSHQFSQMMNLARHDQLLGSEHYDLPGDSDAISRLIQRTSSRSTPDGSRRWRRMSDTESDGFDNMDSLYGENESNVSFGARIFHGGDSDTISVSVYGGDSDVSFEDHGFLETETFPQSIERGDFESDSDIDPMHTGLVTWESDGHDDIEDEYGYEEADVDENLGERPVARYPSETGLGSSGGSPVLIRRNRFLGLEQIIQLRIRERDHLTIRGFEGLLGHLNSENENSRRGAPPASESFVNNLPRVVINENQKKSDEITCAVCKDPLSLGIEAIQLPCYHLYHPCCILPWLARRNSCPLCRYELPTDDVDYDVGLHDTNTRTQNQTEIREIQQQDDSFSSDDDVYDQIESETVEVHGEIQELGKLRNTVNVTNGGRGRWCFLVAAPVVSILGIAIVLWLGKPQRISAAMFLDSSQASSFPPENNQRQSRRWWNWF